LGELQVVFSEVGLLLVPLLLDDPERLLLKVADVGQGIVDPAVIAIATAANATTTADSNGAQGGSTTGGRRVLPWVSAVVERGRVLLPERRVVPDLERIRGAGATPLL
jgi:hypothetical protein